MYRRMKCSSTRAGVVPASRVLVMKRCHVSAVSAAVVRIVQSTFWAIGRILSAGAEDGVGGFENLPSAGLRDYLSGAVPVLNVSAALLEPGKVQCRAT